ncbi:Hypothetical protein PHPALM_493 [Phytophthora palmivora]|uniref:Uncharacterized protein n=1 Tax=Phytophthora palmivora TaxID=4796 RepID=A0A2P4YUQ2_9STRA|nr:Hypothetical protein PHPALM_493 [Phytophthora palmivora]
MCTGYQPFDNRLMIARQDVEVYVKQPPMAITSQSKPRLRPTFGVVDKGGNNASISGRTIHDLSYPVGDSINDCTDPGSVIKPEYSHCDAVANEILRMKREHPHAKS